MCSELLTAPEHKDNVWNKGVEAGPGDPEYRVV